VSRRKRSVRGSGGRRDWIQPNDSVRPRPWAYEELLFGDNDLKRMRAVRSLASDLASERAELQRMQDELHEQSMRIAGLEGRLRALSSYPTSERVGRVDPDPDVRLLTSDTARSRASLERAQALARCEGFRVDSPTGTVGFVEGLRFESRIDEPDLLEVRGGRFGRKLLLIPTEEVEDVSLAEQRLVVRAAPTVHEDHVHELVNRLRGALSAHHPPA
jgi:hypothetical protein